MSGGWETCRVRINKVLCEVWCPSDGLRSQQEKLVKVRSTTCSWTGPAAAQLLSHHSIVMILTDADPGEQTALFCCFLLPSIFLPQVTHMKMPLITTLYSGAESAHMLMCLLMELRGRLSGLTCDDTWRCSSNLRFSVFTWLQAEFLVIFSSAVSFTMSLTNIRWNLTLVTYCDVLLS